MTGCLRMTKFSKKKSILVSASAFAGSPNKAVTAKTHTLTQLQRVHWTLFIFLEWKHEEDAPLDIYVSLPFSKSRPLAIKRATQSQTIQVCPATCIEHSGVAVSISFYTLPIYCCKQSAPPIKHLSAPERDDALGGMPARFSRDLEDPNVEQGL